jgi:hypothetical protein
MGPYREPGHGPLKTIMPGFSTVAGWLRCRNDALAPVEAVMKLAWTDRPDLCEAECDVALVSYRAEGGVLVVWRILPKIADVDEGWAAAIAQDAARAINATRGERARPGGR